MTYGALYRLAENRLGSAFEAGQLFTHATNKRVIHLPFLGEKPAPDQNIQMLEKLIRRRLEGEPLQYLLGEWEFYGLPLKVGRGVLIPRQDTETLVDVALEKLGGVEQPETLDLCSGSGCVAIALAHERPDAHVTALELSDKAYAYLIENIALNESPVRPVRGDLMDYVHPVPLDLLVSNPPYIPRESIATLQPEVLREPRRALDGGVDGLDFYRAIIRLYRPQIKPGGHICMEVGAGQSGRVRAILEREGFLDTGAVRDYGGVERVVFARRGGDLPMKNNGEEANA